MLQGMCPALAYPEDVQIPGMNTRQWRRIIGTSWEPLEWTLLVLLLKLLFSILELLLLLAGQWGCLHPEPPIHLTDDTWWMPGLSARSVVLRIGIGSF